MANPQVAQYAQEAKQYQDRLDTAIDGVVADDKEQLRLIEELNNRPDGWGPEDQALLDQILSRQRGQVEKVEALDAMHAPTVPDLPDGPTDPNGPAQAGQPQTANRQAQTGQQQRQHGQQR